MSLAGLGSDPLLLLSAGEASPTVLCPVLGSSLQEKHGRTGEKDHKGLVLVELVLSAVVPD